MSKKNTTRKSKSKQKKLQTNNGTFKYLWDECVAISRHGYLPFFSQYLNGAKLFSEWIKDCPLVYSSNNAPKVKDILGTIMLSVLSGHTRYSQMQSLFGDQVVAELLGLNKTVSHDSVQRALLKVEADAAEKWLHKHLLKTYESLLSVPYVIDIDPTVKPIYGNQEGAEIGYNPKKPGRPSHCYHTYIIGSLRLVMDVVVKAGNQTAGCYSHDRLWSILDDLPQQLRPQFVRGDIGFGNEATMLGCENRSVNFLFKLKQTSKVKQFIKDLEGSMFDWKDAGDGWLGSEGLLKLTGWTNQRRVIVLRKPKKVVEPSQKQLESTSEHEQLEFELALPVEEIPEYDYQILVTSLDSSIGTIAQLYRDRADCENVFDELKNQWGWGGFTTRDLNRSQIMSRIIALIYNWWNIFCRLANPEKHMEAKTSREVLCNTIAKMAKHGGERLIRLAVPGAVKDEVIEIFDRISSFISSISTATQLTNEERWTAILAVAFKAFLPDKVLKTIADGNQQLLLL